ncbi:TIGR03364 family FAD-dependent oxidoreductase [Microbulbifer sp. Q7]|uniref:TIGR03364 family FAD-dependent oxidoreductase n=1 Tax=Microbulbifer sp. Q7 TaxID=1785091 RepID=UPI00082B7A7F|nr:TIGR03364 family FAD-dependent oxidoreductase [Microbulbifer sp. Q7]
MKFDLAIVGAGALGSFAAYRALKRGYRVLLIDSGQQARGATVRNFGQVVPSGMEIGVWRDLGMRSLDLYRELQPVSGSTIWQQGSLYVASSPEEAQLLDELDEINRELGYPSKRLSPAQCLAHNPALRAGYCQGGLFFPGDMSAETSTLMPIFWQRLAADSALTLLPNTTVTAIEDSATAVGNGVRLTTAAGEQVHTDQVLICCGHLLNRLYPEHLQTPEMQIAKLQMMRIAPAGNITLPGNLLTGLTLRRYGAFKSCPSFTRLPPHGLNRGYDEFDIHILVRQSADGSLILGDSHEYFAASQSGSLDYEISTHINELMLTEAKRILDLPHWRVDSTWNGYYSQENQRGVLLDSPSTHVHLVTGIGGKGMTTGPALMERVVDNLMAGRPLEDSLANP